MYSEIELELFNNEYKGVKGVTMLTQGHPGPNVAVFAVTHGNEIAGFDALKYLYERIKDEQPIIYGKLFLIVHNIEAYKGYRAAIQEREVGVTEFRYLDANLNRVFNEEMMSDKYHEEDYELRRAKEISKLIPEFDYVFDMHSTSSPSIPMIIYYGHEEDIAMADIMHCQKHNLNIVDKLNGSSLLEYAKLYGRRGEDTVAIAHEAGHHFDETAPGEAKRVLLEFLLASRVINIDTPYDRPEEAQEKLDVTQMILVKHEEFNWTHPWKSFDEVKKGDVIAVENGREIVMDDDYVLIMPSANPKINTEAVYLAKKL